MESQNILTTTLTQLKEQREVKNKQYVSIKWELKKLDKEIATIEKLITDANPQEAKPGEV
jgi:predicted  nucleic acid-binding Zn-ribbon protein